MIYYYTLYTFLLKIITLAHTSNANEDYSIASHEDEECTSTNNSEDFKRGGDILGLGNIKPPTLTQLKQLKGCSTLQTPRPLYTSQDWQRLQTIYKSLGGGTVDYSGTVDYPESEVPHDFIPPFKSGYTIDNKGRGIFATRYIRKGEMTYGGKKNYAFFSSGEEYRRFLNELTDAEACDIMMWSWPQWNMGRDGSTMIVVLLDDNSLQNHADGIDDHEESSDDHDEKIIDMISMANKKKAKNGRQVANTGCPPHQECGMFDEYALADIQKGEELVCDYDRFFDQKLWTEFGL